MPGEFQKGDDQFEAQRKELLLQQQYLAVLSEEERQWLGFLFGKEEWAANLLNRIYNVANQSDKKNEIQELVVELQKEIKTGLETRINNYIDVRFAGEPETIEALKEFKDSANGRLLLSRACLAREREEETKQEEAEAELMVGLYGFMAKAKELEPIVAEMLFRTIVESLPNNYQFDLASETVRILNSLALQLGKEAVSRLLNNLFRQKIATSSTYSKKNGIRSFKARLIRTLTIFLPSSKSVKRK